MHCGEVPRLQWTVSNRVWKEPPIGCCADGYPGEAVTDVQRNQIMGHERADVFRRHYLHQTVKVDTQSLYLGAVSREDLIKTVGLMSARRDPRVPQQLDKERLAALMEDSHSKYLTKQRDGLGEDIKLRHATLSAAKAAEPGKYQEYEKAQRARRTYTAKLKRDSLAEYQRAWFDNVDHEEIKRQLQGELPSEFTYTLPNLCPLRTRIAESFSPISKHDDDDSCERLRDLISLVSLAAVTKAHVIPTAPSAAAKGLQCAFCSSDERLHLESKLHPYHTLGTLKRHVQRKHGDLAGSLVPVICPVPSCNCTLSCGNNLMNHMETVHGFYLRATACQ